MASRLAEDALRTLYCGILPLCRWFRPLSMPLSGVQRIQEGSAAASGPCHITAATARRRWCSLLGGRRRRQLAPQCRPLVRRIRTLGAEVTPGAAGGGDEPGPVFSVVWPSSSAVYSASSRVARDRSAAYASANGLWVDVARPVSGPLAGETQPLGRSSPGALVAAVFLLLSKVARRAF